jgi:hypothetical protein
VTASERPETVGELAELYLGNILYALETTATTLEGTGRSDDAGFYRGIARVLAEARGRALKLPTGQSPDSSR